MTLKRIEFKTFKECKSLRSIDLPEQLEYIGKQCFYGSALETIRLPPSLKIIGKDAFQQCENLKMVKFPDNVKII